MEKKEWLRGKYEREYIFEYLITAIIILFMFLIYTYVDNVSITINSVSILDCIWKGDIGNFCYYTGSNIYNIAHPYMAGEAIIVLFPYAIWNIPIWVAQYFFGVIITESVICMLWAKLFYVFIMFVFSYYLYKICMSLWNDSNKAKLAILLCASSVYMHIGVSYAGQNDIVWITLGVMAYYYLSVHNWALFLVLVNISLLIKPYYLIPCIALILINEKDIFKVIYKCFFSVIGYLCTQMLMSGFPGSQENALAGGESMKKMFRDYVAYTIDTPYGTASITIILLIIIYVICYIFRTKEDSQKKAFEIYILSLINIVWLLTAYENFYRVIMVLPWIYILALSNEELLEANMCIDVALSFIWTLVCINTKGAFLDSYRGMKPTILHVTEMKPTTELEHGSLYLLIQEVLSRSGGYETICKILYAIWIGLVIAILLINCPMTSKYMNNFNTRLTQRKWLIRVCLWAHVFMIVPFVVISCLRVTGRI